MNSKFGKIDYLGTCEYRRALSTQQQYHAKVVAGELESALLVVEHPPVLTLGKSSDPKFILNSELGDGIEVVRTERGGEVTAHMPGQIVVYPIVPIAAWQLSPRRYVCLLEQAVINLLARYDISAGRDSVNPGIWVGHNKICALGIRISQRVSMHGLALNVDPDLALFDKIVACGIEGRGVTRMEDCTQRVLDRIQVTNDLVEELQTIFS